MTRTVSRPAITRAPSTTAETANGNGSETAHPGHCRTEDEGEKHRDRRWDQHIATGIERDDRHRANEGDGGRSQKARVAFSRRREIGELHRASKTRSRANSGLPFARSRSAHLHRFMAATPRAPRRSRTELTDSPI